MLFSTLASIVTLSLVSAIKINAPNTGDTWAVTSGTSETVAWDYVSTDPVTFAMVLVNQNAAFLPNSPVTLNANVTTSSGSATVTYPSGTWPSGTGFQINFVVSTSNTNSILAQTGMFNITSSGAAAVTPTTITSPSSTAVVGGSASASGVASASATDASATGASGNGTIPSASGKSSAPLALSNPINLVTILSSVVVGGGMVLGLSMI